MSLRSSDIGSDFILGRSILRRQGLIPYFVGEIAGLGIGGGYGTTLALATKNEQEKSSWIHRGMMLGTLAWTVNLTLASRATPKTLHRRVSSADALVYYTHHLVYGLVTAGLMKLWGKDKPVPTMGHSRDDSIDIKQEQMSLEWR
jgi:hypothetical protein